MDTIAQELIDAAYEGNKQRVNDLVDQLLAAHEGLNSVNKVRHYYVLWNDEYHTIIMFGVVFI